MKPCFNNYLVIILRNFINKFTADMVISANAFIIFLGGFETTSSTLAFLFLELAADQQVQETMRAEIREVLDKHDGKITYEVLQELVYMEMVIQGGWCSLYRRYTLFLKDGL